MGSLFLFLGKPHTDNKYSNHTQSSEFNLQRDVLRFTSHSLVRPSCTVGFLKSSEYLRLRSTLQSVGDVNMQAVSIIGLLVVFAVGKGQDFAFPEQAQMTVDPNVRTPLYIPGRCPQNQLLYPGVQDDDWVCDCMEGYIYYPSKDACYAAFRQGPCSKNKYLVLPTNGIIPECQTNHCTKDGRVLYKNWCHRLNKPGGPCGSVNLGGGILGVNATTMELGCLQTADNVLSTARFNHALTCPKGCKRHVDGRCRRSD